MWEDVKHFILDLLFPQFCLNCGREGSYLCQDCQALLEISGHHQIYQTTNLKDLYFPLPYQNPLIKNLIEKFKYQPFVKELGKILSSLIITHFQLLDNQPDFSNFILIPLPLDKKRQRWRGFNQSEEIGKELSKFFKIPLISDCLVKIKETLPQVELTDKERRENIKNAFLAKNQELVKNKKILLVDDVYTTGSTMEEAARVLKKAGAKEIIGIVIARG
jgi:ComF family protein